ncbi:MAG: MFS transporter [Candidatus Riflebacteria bacterium]|nr:MFS transporter [Candidatus Riflebacteria bacterium]
MTDQGTCRQPEFQPPPPSPGWGAGQLAGSGQIVALYVAFFVSHGVAVPYLPVAMKRLGLDGDAIGLAMACSLVVQFATPPVWGYLADRWGGSRLLLATASVGAVAGMVAACALPGPLGFLLGFLLFAFSRTPVSPLLDARALRHPAVGPAGYGRVRRWGSVGFVAAVAGVGAVLDVLPARAIPALVAVPWLAMFCLALAGGPGLDSSSLHAGRPPLARLYAQRSVWAFLFLSALHAGAGVPFETYFAVHAADHGLPGRIIGLAWAAGVGFEVLVLSCLGTLIARLGPRRLLLIAYGAGVVRWGLTAALPGGAALAAVQVLHGLTFGASFGASVVWMSRAVPRELANSSQSVFAAVAWGLGGIVAQLVCGPVYQRLGGQFLFAAAAVCELLPFAGMLLLREPVEPQGPCKVPGDDFGNPVSSPPRKRGSRIDATPGFPLSRE